MRLGALTLALSLLLGCAPEEETICVHDPALTYENFGRGFVGQFCNGCHSSIIPPEQRNEAPDGYNFDTYEGVLYWADKIEEQVLDSGEMPPGGGPTEDELVLFDEWMACEVLPDAERYWYEDP